MNEDSNSRMSIIPTKDLFFPVYFQFSSAVDDTFTLTYSLFILVQFSLTQFNKLFYIEENKS